jgi:uncharacterized surface protein with fasciclin (FAS1) repeats
MIQIRTVFVILLTGSLMFSSCKKDTIVTGFFDENVLSIATFLENNKEEYSKYWDIIQTTGLYHTLNAYNPNGDGFTLFLPTDDAFDRYIQQNDKYESFEALLEDVEFLWLLSRYHLVNRMFLSNEFPYGALPDSTSTGDYLTIGIEVKGDSSHYTVNNVAPLEELDIETTNGYVQIISEVLEPISYNSYEWLKYVEGYSILASALEYSGLKDTMNIYKTSSTGELIKNAYTVFAEHDSIYERNGIYTFDDLVDRVHTPGYELDDPDGGLYQFAAYHLLEGSYFLDAFEGSSNYNSYAVYPVSVSAGLDIRLNAGVDTFRYVITGADTTVINYVGVYYQESNVNTKNGPIHFVDQILELFQPRRSDAYFQFLEDPKILEASRNQGTYEFVDPDIFELISWDGTERLIYEKGTQANNRARSGDYIELEGKSTFAYNMPKIMPGRYQVRIRAHANDNQNATIQVRIDGKRIGGNVNLTSGGNSANPFSEFTLGIIEFTSYEGHLLETSALIPGSMKLDYVRFIPE